MWSYEIDNASVKIWREGSAPITFHKKPDTAPHLVLKWLYDIATLNIEVMSDDAEIRSFVEMICAVSSRVIPP